MSLESLTVRFLAEWWDWRDWGNPVGAFLNKLREWDFPEWSTYVISGIIGILAILLWLLLSQLAFIWIERRVIGLMQNRIGPNRVGPMGLLQPIADALKLLLKEAITNRHADRWLFWAAPIAIFVPTIVLLAVIPFGQNMVLANIDVGVLFLIAATSTTTLAVFAAGWSSNNKYSLLGAMRSIAMLISYELIQVLALLGVVLFTSTMNLNGVVAWQKDFNVWLVLLQPVAALAYIFSGAVEINRSPTDISEAESEIVAGYHTEYSGLKFGLFYAAEYFAGFGIAAVFVALYLGGWSAWGLEEWVPGWILFLAKVYLVFFVYIWTRGTLPRLRIDQLMGFAWKFMLPLMLVNVLVTGGEFLLWKEGDLSANVALPVFGVVNALLAVVLVVAGARLLGRLRPDRRPARALLTKEVGVILYGEAAPRV